MKKNTILITVLVGLVLLFAATNYFEKNSTTNFKAEVIQLDTALVDKFSIYPPPSSAEEPIIISRTADLWEVAQGDIKGKANQNTVKNALGQLSTIRAERLVAKTKEKWPSYELTDSLARRIEIQEKGKEDQTKLYLGRNPFFRVKDRPETYAIKRELSNTFKREFNTWRNSEFLKTNKDSITRVKFEAKGKNDYLLTKTDSVWTLGNLSPDSSKVAQFLNGLRNQSSSQFADRFTPINEADYKLILSGKSMEDLIVKAYRDTSENRYFLSSSQHPEVFFESDSLGLFKTLFVDQDFFKRNQN